MGRGWKVIGLFIIRNRIPLLIAIGAITVFFSFFQNVGISYDFIQIVPKSDPDLIEYKAFKKEFGEDGNTAVVGLEGDVFTPKMLNGISSLTRKLKDLKGVQSVTSIATLLSLKKDTTDTSFKTVRLLDREITSQQEADSLKDLYQSLPFYKGLLVNKEATSTLLAVVVDSATLNTADKTRFALQMKEICDSASATFGAKVHYSGLPYIRAYTLIHLPKEMVSFLLASVLVMIIVMFLFFRSIWAVLIPLLMIAIIIVWTLGTMKLLGFRITMLTCVMPALITVIGIPNAIYLTTKYHIEFRKTGNKIAAVLNVIQKIGLVTVITNLNTAAGFLVLGFSNITLMKEFGVIAGISVTITFFISLALIPIIFSYLPAPSVRQTKHIDRKMINWMIDFIDRIVHTRRKLIYIITIVVTAVSIYGTMLVKPVAFLVDDMPAKGEVQKDLRYFESNYNGVMPFEIVISPHINTGRIDRFYKARYPQKIDTLYQRLDSIPDISRPLSVMDFIKFTRQAFFGGLASEYKIPDKEEMLFMEDYIRNSKIDSLFTLNQRNGTSSNPDSTRKSKIADNLKHIRVKASIKDVGSIRLKSILAQMNLVLDSLFVVNQPSGKLKDSSEYKLFGDDNFQVKYAGKEYSSGEIFVAGKDTAYEVVSGSGKVDFSDRIKVTGTTKIFTKSNDYLISNLLQNMVLALIVIALMMVPLFGTGKMMIISLIPNILPLLITSGIMGLFGIPLKPSTALIFSMSFGIAIDNSIHYLARYRLGRKAGETVAAAVTDSFKDTGMGMIYTSLILLLGFVIFAFSTFGSTRALGQLTSITLFIALFSNLFLLPAMIISFNRDEDKEVGSIGIDDEEEELEAIKEQIATDDDGPKTENGPEKIS